MQLRPDRGGEILVRIVADRDDQIPVMHDVPDVRRAARIEAQAVAVGHGDGTRVHPRDRLGAGRGDRAADPVAPQRRGQLRTGRVVGADEHHSVGVAQRRRCQRGQDAGSQPQVRAAAIALGPGPHDQARLLQHLHVVGDQVGGHAQVGADLPGGRVPQRERVHDRQPRRVTERGVDPRPRMQGRRLAVH